VKTQTPSVSWYSHFCLGYAHACGVGAPRVYLPDSAIYIYCINKIIIVSSTIYWSGSVRLWFVYFTKIDAVGLLCSATFLHSVIVIYSLPSLPVRWVFPRLQPSLYGSSAVTCDQLFIFIFLVIFSQWDSIFLYLIIHCYHFRSHKVLVIKTVI
jgi:hypothetical protein